MDLPCSNVESPSPLPVIWLGQIQDLLSGHTWAGTGESLSRRSSQNFLAQETCRLAEHLRVL